MTIAADISKRTNEKLANLTSAVLGKPWLPRSMGGSLEMRGRGLGGLIGAWGGGLPMGLLAAVPGGIVGGLPGAAATFIPGFMAGAAMGAPIGSRLGGALSAAAVGPTNIAGNIVRKGTRGTGVDALLGTPWRDAEASGTEMFARASGFIPGAMTGAALGSALGPAGTMLGGLAGGAISSRLSGLGHSILMGPTNLMGDTLHASASGEALTDALGSAADHSSMTDYIIPGIGLAGALGIGTLGAGYLGRNYLKRGFNGVRRLVNGVM